MKDVVDDDEEEEGEEEEESVVLERVRKRGEEKESLGTKCCCNCRDTDIIKTIIPYSQTVTLPVQTLSKM